ncbi:D-hexose-6-phosphate mutarotase [Arsenicicoccus dermatophilus]|uniref:D-hexose-6-phosphate mutarotase n=1 Tax=Arsenicicoccus dermatophilus TaxID=1076331 RepID=UPI001F4C7C0B|nr:D-hexose-6-phosphate mutarotase [Arsenicicoccus dermatophilus]MCH8614276.1 D-hexose-6-phosphate mutarotase [Arsenicicoccus dermatophilus]
MTTLPVHDISGPEATATIHDQGAHLLTWAPQGQAPVLWASPQVRLEEGKGIRGGVPICFPWFGPGRTGDRTPTHGPARTTPWRSTTIEPGHATYAITGAELGVQDLEATYDVRAGARLELTFTVRNTGAQELTYEEALHAYLTVGDAREITVEGLAGATYVDKTDQGRSHRQDGELRLTRETDRVFRSAGPVTVVDPVLGRRLRVTKTGSASTVVWNPWDELSASLGDMGPEAWRTMVCVEGGNAMADEITLAPGDSHTLTYHLEVLPL